MIRSSKVIQSISLVLYNTRADELNKSYIILQRNKNQDYTDLNFKKFGVLKLINHHVESWTVSEYVKKWSIQILTEERSYSV